MNQTDRRGSYQLPAVFSLYERVVCQKCLTEASMPYCARCGADLMEVFG